MNHDVTAPAEQPLPYWRAGTTKDSDAYEVFVDNVHPPLCVAASAKEGWADYLATDDDGHILRDGLTEKPLLARIEGRVEIRPVRDAAWASWLNNAK